MRLKPRKELTNYQTEDYKESSHEWMLDAMPFWSFEDGV